MHEQDSKAEAVPNTWHMKRIMQLLITMQQLFYCLIPLPVNLHLAFHKGI